MIYFFPPYFFVSEFAILVGGGVLGLIFLVMLARSLLKKREKKYEAGATIRFAAFLIDLFMITTLHNFIAGVRYYLKYGETIVLTDFYNYFNIQILTNMLYYIISPTVLITGLYIFLYIDPSVLGFLYLFAPYLICYVYFIVFDLFFKGNTLGRLAFRIKLRNINGRTIKFYEVLVNDLGKSFFVLADLIIGLIVYSTGKIPEGTSTKPNQFRFMQRLSGIVLVRIPKQVPE
jgi:hypothetical protein